MRKKLSEISNEFKIHPINLIHNLVKLGISFEECWPNTETLWINSLKQINWNRFGNISKKSENDFNKNDLPPMEGLCIESFKILDKLERKDNWGSHSIPFDLLRKHYFQNINGLDKIIQKLCNMNYLIIDEHRNLISLNTTKKKEIYILINNYRKNNN